MRDRGNFEPRLHRRVVIFALATVGALSLLAPAGAGAEWDPTQIALPEGETAGALQAVSCPAAGACVAVGESSGGNDPNDLMPMVATQVGGAWGRGAVLTRHAGAVATTLLGVSCPAVGSCVAVGYEQAPSAFSAPKVPVAAVETEGTWGQTFAIAPPGNAQYAILYAVSCPAVGSCEAVGGDETGPFGIAETGGTWQTAVQIATAPAGEPSTPNPIPFRGVGCAAVGNCIGVGTAWNAAGERLPSAAMASAGSWGATAQVAPPAGVTSSTLGGVSCPAVGSCVATGYGTRTYVVSYAGGAWGGATPIDPPGGAPSSALTGVACPAVGACLAAGSYYPNNGQSGLEGRPMIVSSTGGAWGLSDPLALPAGTVYAMLNGVGCPTSGLCEAVGTSGSDPTGTDQMPVAYGGELTATASGATEPPAASGTSSSTTTTVTTTAVPTTTVTTAGSPSGGGATGSCALALAGASIRVDSAHSALVRITDTGTAACAGRVSISIPVVVKGRSRTVASKSKKPRSRTIGSAPLALPPGKGATIAVRLNGAGRAALARSHGRLRARIAVGAAGGMRLERSVRLKAARPGNHKRPGAR